MYELFIDELKEKMTDEEISLFENDYIDNYTRERRE